jgi:predicted HNH restriction endonuclease
LATPASCTLDARVSRGPHLIGRQQAMTLVPLTQEDVERVEQAVTACFADESDIEGTKTEVVQFSTKRSRKLRDRAFHAAHGVCCVCRQDYSAVLGGRGVRVLQVHHREQLSARKAPAVTRLDELAVVCANCHLLLHLDPKYALKVEQLRKMLVADGSRWPGLRSR